MLGAYFGSTRIQEGAGGLGGGPLRAYRDGSLGDADVPGDTGPLDAYDDGVLGTPEVDQQMPGALQAYRDGSLGWLDQAAHGIGQSEGELRAYQDGIFGAGGDYVAEGELRAYQDGSLGRALGAATAGGGGVLALSDPNVLREVKGMMALLAPEAALCASCTALYTPEFYTSGIWEPEASILWQHAEEKAPQGKVAYSADAGAQIYPNAVGVGWMAATIGAPTQSAFGPAYLAQNFPLVSAWMSGGAGPVTAPYLSIPDKVKGVVGGGGSSRMSTIAMYGLGATLALGLVLVLARKKRA